MSIPLNQLTLECHFGSLINIDRDNIAVWVTLDIFSHLHASLAFDLIALPPFEVGPYAVKKKRYWDILSWLFTRNC